MLQLYNHHKEYKNKGALPYVNKTLFTKLHSNSYLTQSLRLTNPCNLQSALILLCSIFSVVNLGSLGQSHTGFYNNPIPGSPSFSFFCLVAFSLGFPLGVTLIASSLQSKVTFTMMHPHFLLQFYFSVYHLLAYNILCVLLFCILSIPITYILIHTHVYVQRNYIFF